MHIEEEVLQRFHEGKLEPDEMILVLEHVGECSFCADKLMQIEEENQLKAPAYLKNNVISRTQMVDIKAKTVLKNTSKKAELFLYGLKTTTAVLGALILLFSISYFTNINGIEGWREEVNVSANLGSELFEKSNEIVSGMTDFSHQIINGGRN